MADGGRAYVQLARRLAEARMPRGGLEGLERVEGRHALGHGGTSWQFRIPQQTDDIISFVALHNRSYMNDMARPYLERSLNQGVKTMTLMSKLLTWSER